jgi:hypothetical protein
MNETRRHLSTTEVLGLITHLTREPWAIETIQGLATSEWIGTGSGPFAPYISQHVLVQHRHMSPFSGRLLAAQGGVLTLVGVERPDCPDRHDVMTIWETDVVSVSVEYAGPSDLDIPMDEPSKEKTK